MISIKSDRELNLMRKAGKVTALAAQAVCQAVRPGISTGELDALAERIIRGNGAIPAFKGYHGFPGSICASLNSQVVHGIPGETILQEGDIISIDIGAVLEGYYGRRVFRGPGVRRAWDRHANARSSPDS
jgi:methionyl aminopeptidase